MTEASKRAQKKYVEKNKDKLNEYKAKKQKRNIIMMTNIEIKRKKPI